MNSSLGKLHNLRGGGRHLYKSFRECVNPGGNRMENALILYAIQNYALGIIIMRVAYTEYGIVYSGVFIRII